MSRRRTVLRDFGLLLAGQLVVAQLGACAATSVRTDYDPEANFERYRTYTIRSGPLVSERDVEVMPENVVRNRIHDELAEGLAGKGITPARLDPPDIIVTYAVTAEREPELVETVSEDPNWSYGGHNVFPRDVDRGTLVIDVIDNRAGKLVWRSIARAEDEDVRSAKFIERAVDKAMEKFPPMDTSS